eukprot:gene13566-27155_t
MVRAVSAYDLDEVQTWDWLQRNKNWFWAEYEEFSPHAP